DPPAERPGRGLAPPSRGETSRGDLGRGGHEPMRPAMDARREMRPGRGLPPEPVRTDPIRSGRDALLASLDRPPGPGEAGGRPAPPQRPAATAGPGSAFDDDPDLAKEVPAVPSLAVLRPRRTGPAAGSESTGPGDKPRKRLPSWDDVLFGSAPAR